MTVQFILGRSGTGKTSFCIKAIVEALLEPGGNQPLILLVPEQATYQAERAILSDPRIAGYSRLQVLSFDRLSFLLSGRNTARPALTQLGREMVVHKILRQCGSKLKVFGPSAKHPGAARDIADTIAELHQYAKGSEDIQKLLTELAGNELNSLTSLKFGDIKLILEEYLKFIKGKFIDLDIQLSQACNAVGRAAFVKGARLWVDGFSGFNAAELALLAELLKVVSFAQVALCLNPQKVAKDIDRTSPFYPTERTYTELIRTIKDHKLKLAEPVILDEPIRFSDCQELAHIERHLFELQPTKFKATKGIRVVSAADMRAEVRFVARQIHQLVRNENLRYRDIAVIASDLGSYENYIRACFEDYYIPFFLDKKKPLNKHPLVQMLCSALRVVTEGFLHSDIFSYLKTDLVPVERSEVDFLENYCLAFGIMGSDWLGEKDWDFAEPGNDTFDEKRINQIRKKVAGPLFELREQLCSTDGQSEGISASQFTEGLFDFIEVLQIRRTIVRWIEQAQEQGDNITADEHQQFYDKFVSVFDELAEVFGHQRISCQDFIAIINSAFGRMTLAFIPPNLDEVLVGSIERSRHPDLKAAFLIGTTQKQFPTPIVYDNILAEEDRKAAESLDFNLGASFSRGLAERQYLAYIAFTRPSKFLYVTYPARDSKDKPQARSQFIDNLQALFENIPQEQVADEQPEADSIYCETELAQLLCSQLGRDSIRDDAENKDDLIDLLDDMRADKELCELSREITSAIEYDNKGGLEQNVTRELFGEQISLSATRLGSFAACPYQFFARYLLELKERQEFKFEPLDTGRFYHRVLDSLLKKLNEEKKDFATTSDDELLRILHEETSNITNKDPFILNFTRHSSHNAFIIDSACEVLEDCVLAIGQMVRAGDFIPCLSEVSFGKVEGTGSLGEFHIDLFGGRRLLLNGKIDRIDFLKQSDNQLAIIFDYKKRLYESFSWRKFYHGLDMQLPIYALAACGAAGSGIEEVAGAFFMPVETTVDLAKLNEIKNEGKRFRHKVSGFFNGNYAAYLDKNAAKESRYYNFFVKKQGQPYGIYEKRGILEPDHFEKVLRFTKDKIIALAQEILSGKIDIQPYRLGQDSACSRCRYKTVCRFDWQINDYIFLESVTKMQVLERAGEISGR
ncbi:MAG: exodeoxyribonuclease V subunit gamma [Sedimentisphaerales bacterium]|nr:exodeoxyribonuclease V subunit gamma [Sedimentisphaerales bacterium]